MITRFLDAFITDEIVEVLRSSGTVAFQTDTVFGIACLFDDEVAIDKVKKIKDRDKDKPLPMMCDSKEMIRKVAYTDERIERLIDTFCPGPLTIIFNKREEVADYVTNGFKTIGIRLPDKKDILDVIKALGKPILVTSCNMSGEPSIKSHKDICAIFDGKIDMIVKEDAKSEVASTIIDITKEPIKILREGIIKEEAIKEVYYA